MLNGNRVSYYCHAWHACQDQRCWNLFVALVDFDPAHHAQQGGQGGQFETLVCHTKGGPDQKIIDDERQQQEGTTFNMMENDQSEKIY